MLVGEDIENEEDRSAELEESINASIVSDSYVSFEDNVSDSSADE